LLEKATKKEGTVRYCKNDDCDYKIAVGKRDLTLPEAADTKAPIA
jgi:hypothetical protein